MLQLADTTLGGLLPRGVRFGLSSMAVCFSEFPPKETFLTVVRNGNYATWPKLTVTLIHQYMPDSDETAKGHLKGQRQGIRSTKYKVFKKLLEDEETRIKIEGESSPYQPLPPTKYNDMFLWVVDLTK